uniref:Glycoprotein M6B n=1 Tax=Anas platyrhynchos platyrhynchos TaxID=8840 RepID=A0A493TVW2_ANAPP
MFGETLQQVPACSLVAGARCKQRASQCCRTSFRAGKRLQKVRSCGHQGNWVVSGTRTTKLLSSKPAGERNKSEPPSASGVATGAPSPCRGTAAVPGGRGAALLRSAVPRAVPCRALRGRAGPPGRRRQAGTSPPLSPPEASGARHWASCGRCPPQRIPHSPARHGTAPALRPHPRRAPHGESQPWNTANAVCNLWHCIIFLLIWNNPFGRRLLHNKCCEGASWRVQNDSLWPLHQWDGIIPWNAVPGKACGPILENICNTNEFYMSYHLFIVACAGAGATVIALIHFLMILSSNWAYLKDASKMQAYQDIKAKEEQELQDIQSRSKEQLNSYT